MTPDPGQPAAFFDLDLTLLSVNSASVWLKRMWREGEIGPLALARSIGWLVQYKLAILDLEEITSKGLKDLEGVLEADMRLKVEAWYEAEIRDLFYPEALELVEHHRRQGHRLFLATGSSPYISHMVAQQLDLEGYVCTLLEVREGRFTGHALSPVCYGPGKLQRAEDLALREGIDLSQSWFYTDSYTDLPLLRRVGYPVAANPDPRLRRLALKEGIPIKDFSF